MIFINLIGTEPVVMETNTNTKDAPGAIRQNRRLPYEYICIDSHEAPQVMDWLNSAGVAGDREVAEVHLRLCFRCQETVVHRMQIDEEFKIRAGRCLHLTSNENEKPAELVQERVDQSSAHDDRNRTNPSKSMKAGGKG